jgi:hypothetical protein
VQKIRPEISHVVELFVEFLGHKHYCLYFAATLSV